MRHALIETYEDQDLDTWSNPGTRWQQMEERRKQKRLLEPMPDRLDWRKDAA